MWRLGCGGLVVMCNVGAVIFTMLWDGKLILVLMLKMQQS